MRETIEWLFSDYGLNFWTLILCVLAIVALVMLVRMFKQEIGQHQEPQTLEEFDKKIEEYERKRNALLTQKFVASIDKMMDKYNKEG